MIWKYYLEFGRPEAALNEVNEVPIVASEQKSSFAPVKLQIYIAWNLSFNITFPPPPKHHSEHKINHSKYWIHQEKINRMAEVLTSESVFIGELQWSVLETLVLAFSIMQLKVIEIHFEFDLDQNLYVTKIACSYLMLTYQIISNFPHLQCNYSYSHKKKKK